jgi:hypothetical protein
MNKAALPLILSIAFALVLAQPAQALSILIDGNGNMSFQSGQVLGKDNESESEHEKEVEREDEKKEDEHKEQESEKSKEEVKETPKPENKSSEKAPEPKRELKNVSAREGKLLKIKNTREKTEVSVEQKKSKPTPKPKTDVLKPGEKTEEIETDSVNIQMPANQKPELESESESENEREDINEEIKRIKKERSERKDKLEIRTETNDDGTQEFKIESGAIKAKFKSSDFTIDPTTNAVKITTADGQTHTLTHLPDQALEQMISTKKLGSTDVIDQSELTIETKDDGSVVYKTKVTNKRKLFGFIPFNYESEIELNDADSEVSTKPTDTSFVSRLLQGLSL